MSDIRFEEQQQLQAIKEWFQQNALYIVGAILLACAIFFGPDFYQSYKNSKIWPVSDTYNQFTEAVANASAGPVATEQELALVDDLVDILIQDYPDSHYAFLASLSTAGLSVKLGNYEAAKERLDWAAQQAEAEADVQLVNYRLALVEAQLGDTEAALERLSAANQHFAPLYAAARGDIHASLGQKDQAISAYEEALSLMTDDDPVQRNTIELKLGSLRSGVGALSQE